MNVIVIDQAKITEIVYKLSEQWLRDYFADQKKVLPGEEILQFTPSKQVNLFLLLQVSQKWADTLHQVEKFPYIDFQAEEIRNFLKELRAIGLKYIQIPQEELKPILQQAIYNTIKLILEPIGTLTKFFFGNQTAISVGILEKYSPYFDLFDFVIQSILTYMKKNQLDKLEKHLFEEKAKRVLEVYQKKRNLTLDQLREEMFKELTEMSLQELFKSKPPIEIEKKASSPLQTNSVNPDTDEKVILKNLFGDVIEKQEENQASLKETNSPRSNPLLSAIDTSPQLHQKFKKSETLKDSIEEKVKITEIPLHKQYQYVEQLFNGDNLLFKQAIDKINQFSSYDDALHYLREEVFSKTKPDPNNYLLDEFLTYIKKRLSD